MLSFKRKERKLIADYKLSEIYKLYKQNSKNPIPRDKYLKALKMYFEGTTKKTGIIDLMIKTNLQLRLPKRLGTVLIMRYKRVPKINHDGSLNKTRLIVDWDKTKKLWEKIYPGKTSDDLKQTPGKKLIYRLNEHTNMWMGFFKWDRISSNVPNQFFYNLELTRRHKTSLSGHLIENPDLINLYYKC